mmetsp:Transcript_66759/g.131619  ORF Transcript_66759/g.131619 Transcript_66759/m.131619 type:complete len:92 (+) Transcript_66759:631-906(+)
MRWLPEAVQASSELQVSLQQLQQLHCQQLSMRSHYWVCVIQELLLLLLLLHWHRISKPSEFDGVHGDSMLPVHFVDFSFTVVSVNSSMTLL